MLFVLFGFDFWGQEGGHEGGGSRRFDSRHQKHGGARHQLHQGGWTHRYTTKTKIDTPPFLLEIWNTLLMMPS